MNKLPNLLIALLAASWLTACDNVKSPSPANTSSNETATQAEEEHGHDEIALGTYDVGGISVEAAQGHGSVEPGKEGHLVIKLPYNDKGASTVRVWLGTEDRTLSSVGKGEYAASHDDYDAHAIAPDPLSEATKWWVEIEKPDGSKVVGGIPLLKNIVKE